MALYSVSFTTDSTTYITTIESDADDYELITDKACRRILESDGFDISAIWRDCTIEELEN